MNTTAVALLNVVRGNDDWPILLEYAVDIRHIAYENRWEFGVYAGEPVIISESDVVEGIKKKIDNKHSITTWAQFLLAASDLIDMENLNDAEGGLLDCLWAISDGDLECAHQYLGK